MNWKDKDEVIRYAKRLGKGQTVYQHPARSNFNITHTSRKDLYEPSWVVYSVT